MGTVVPDWVEIRDAPEYADPRLEVLGDGEKQAIILAELYCVGSPVLLLLDEAEARRHARARHIATTGTLGILKAFAVNGWIELPEAFGRLRASNFRVDPVLLENLLAEDAERK